MESCAAGTGVGEVDICPLIGGHATQRSEMLAVQFVLCGNFARRCVATHNCFSRNCLSPSTRYLEAPARRLMKALYSFSAGAFTVFCGS